MNNLKVISCYCLSGICLYLNMIAKEIATANANAANMYQATDQPYIISNDGSPNRL